MGFDIGKGGRQLDFPYDFRAEHRQAVYRRLVRSSYHTRAAAGKGIFVTVSKSNHISELQTDDCHPES